MVWNNLNAVEGDDWLGGCLGGKRLGWLWFLWMLFFGVGVVVVVKHLSVSVFWFVILS